jgi:hypothetical protein
MGAASTVLKEEVPADIYDSLHYCENLKNSIADYDSDMVKNEMLRVFKKHSSIISIITSRTKNQLKRFFKGEKSTPDDIYKLIGSSNTYAWFMKFLFMDKADIENFLLKGSSKGEYDEEILVNIVGTSSDKELVAFCDVYEKTRQSTVANLVESKAQKDSPFQRLMLRILSERRNESTEVKTELLELQVKQLHKAGAAKLVGVDENVFFDILLGSSRAHCAALAEEYLHTHNIKLERAINMKFKGNCAKLLLLLVLPLPIAVATYLIELESRILLDKMAIVAVLAKYDKDFLVHVSKACEAAQKKTLLETVQRGLSGNLYKAVEGWIDNSTPDKGYERILENFLEYKRQEGIKLKDIERDSSNQKKCRFLIEKQSEELKKFVEENKIRIIDSASPQKPTTYTVGSVELSNMTSFVKFQQENPEQARKVNRYSLRASSSDGKDYDNKAKHVRTFLQHHFEKFDVDG